MREMKELLTNIFKLTYHILFIIGLIAVLVYLVKDIGGILCQ